MAIKKILKPRFGVRKRCTKRRKRPSEANVEDPKQECKRKCEEVIDAK